MDPKLQLRVQRYGWDAAAPHYEDGWSANLAAPQEAVLEASDLRPGVTVLETAAGSGLVTFAAARAVSPGGQVLATDLSGEMAAQGTATARRLGVSNVAFQQMNAEALDCADDSFDRAICALGLMYMPRPQDALAEMKRVLKPGGRVSLAVWGERRNCGWAELFRIVNARVASEVCPLFFGLGAPGALVADMAAAGFQHIEERRTAPPLSFENEKRLLSAMIDGGPVALAAKRFDDATRDEVEKEFLASVAHHRVGDGYEIPGEFVIATGIA